MPSNKLLFLFLIVFTQFTCQEAQSEPIWQKAKVDVIDSKINFLRLENYGQMLWVGSERGLYRGRKDASSRFLMRKVLFESTNDLYIEENNPQIIFAATNKGLFVSSNEAKTFQRIFKDSDDLSQIVLSVTKFRETVYVGTCKGLFTFNTITKAGQKLMGDLSGLSVIKLVKDEQYVYAATSNGLYRLDQSTNQPEKVFSIGLAQSLDVSEETVSEDSFITEGIKDIDRIGADIYLTTVEGIFVSNDRGQSWDELSIIGLPIEDVRSLVVLNAEIWVASDKGVFAYKNDEWLPLYQGLDSNQIFDLIFDNEKAAYAATNRGIFFVPIEEAVALNHPQAQFSAEFAGQDYAAISNYFQYEPTVRQVQEMAIDYAEVSHKKINQWRSAAQKKAWLPSVSTGLDRNSGERWHWDTTPNPDQLQKGQFVYDWDVSLSWDLSELIWNNDQTSIDSRSKLMVELREDILDEVTRIYFERRRLQIERLTNKEITDVDRFERDMRIAELTATLDGFTNGEFSRQIKAHVS